ncbi:MAG: hypothetical protein ACI9UK_001004 [Candidatus Krumholzibacteriia bacterium]|jgi:hypothetical protein
MIMKQRGSIIRYLAIVSLAFVVFLSLARFDASHEVASRDERLYFPSGNFLVESSVGFRHAAADYLWFRFIQYFGSYAKGNHDLRYFDLLLDGITRLDPRFIEAYHFGSLVAWSEQGDFAKSVDILKRGILHNPDVAKLPFQVAFTYYVFFHDYERAAFWFEAASKCSDATDRESRFAAFARFKAGDDRISLALWKDLKVQSTNAEMLALANKMIEKLERRVRIRKSYGESFIGPIPEL